MLEQAEKDNIKKEIIDKINSILEANGEKFRMDVVNVLNTSAYVKFMGNYRVYDRNKYQSINKKVSKFLSKYGEVNIKSKKIRDSGEKFTAVDFNFQISN